MLENTVDWLATYEMHLFTTYEVNLTAVFAEYLASMHKSYIFVMMTFVVTLTLSLRSANIVCM